MNPGEQLLERAVALLTANTRTATLDGRRFTFGVPSGGRYRFQWFWDSCFHAIVWARIDPERAAEELRSLLAWQCDDGFLPHVIFWDRSLVPRFSWQWLESRSWGVPRTTAMIQPPVLAQAVEAVGDPLAAEALPAVERYYRFLARERDPDGDGLISIIAQFESGLDFSPAYDPKWGASSPWILGLAARLPEVVHELVFRFNRRHVEDVLVNSVHADALQALARLAALRGDARLEEWATVTGRR